MELYTRNTDAQCFRYQRDKPEASDIPLHLHALFANAPILEQILRGFDTSSMSLMENGYVIANECAFVAPMEMERNINLLLVATTATSHSNHDVPTLCLPLFVDVPELDFVADIWAFGHQRSRR